MHYFLQPTIKLLFLFVLWGGTLTAQSDWVFKNEKDDVRVYYKKSETVHEIKLMTTFNTDVSALVKLFGEVPLYSKWGYKVSSSKLLKKVSETEIYYYSTIDFPWPMSDRDVVMHSKITQDKETGTVTSVSYAAPNFMPLKEGYERMTVANTKWVLQPMSDGTVKAEYYIYSHPGGSIPDWLVNLAIDVGPRETVKGMKDFLKLPAYKDVRLAHIRNQGQKGM